MSAEITIQITAAMVADSALLESMLTARTLAWIVREAEAAPGFGAA